jgi:hypothetical protein
MSNDAIIANLSLSRERLPDGRPRFTWADEEFVRRLDTNRVTWGQLASALEHMQIMRTKPEWGEGSEVRVWMRLPEWWRSVELTAAVPPAEATVLKCDTIRHSCGVASDGQERAESSQLLGMYPPGHHEVRFHARFRSIFWLADARESWEPTFTLRFDVVKRSEPRSR